MTLTTGTRLGPYEVAEPIGAGGMGEVYKARDTRLERTVAIKVLPSTLAADEGRRARFEREARAISSLNHPHICTLHDVGHADGVDYLVMEYLEGETLADRLQRGPLPVEQALRHGIEIAGALEKAHRQGIVHRDLKPANVMLTKSGAKLLDFGLAKLQPTPTSAGDSVLSQLATGTRQLTAEGTLVGTFQYMSPEQLEGREPDARSDIFAFGVLLYEMVTGRHAFTGKSQASLIAAILASDPPPITSVQPLSPPALERVIRTCLAKDPDDRWQSAHDLGNEIRWIAQAGSAAGVPAPVAAQRRTRERWAWAVAAVFGTAALALAALLIAARREPALRVVHASILPPQKVSFASTEGAPVLSPDGRRLAFAGRSLDGGVALWVRSMDGPTAQALAGTAEASFPFWSPDGRYLGFFAEGKLKKIDASGGPPQILCDARVGRGGTWNADGVIVFAATPRDGISRVPAAGGSATKVTELDDAAGEFTHRWPAFLPGGRHFLFTVRARATTAGNGSGVFVGDVLGKDKPRRLLPDITNAGYSRGHILFVRNRALMAQRFDTRALQLEGEAFPLADGVLNMSPLSLAVFDAVETGEVVYQPGEAGGLSQLAWVDRAGKALGTVGLPGDHWMPRLSHDGRRLAVVINDAGGAGDIWILDVARGVATRFTFDPGDDVSPVWAPDDKRIVFTSNRSGAGDLYQRVASGAAPEELLSSSKVRKIPTDWSPQGILFFAQGEKTRADLFALTAGEPKEIPILRTDFSEYDAQFSPDGRWIAYVSDESGRNEVYAQPFPGPGGKWQLSTAGGSMPRWSRDGREVFYWAPDRRITSVPVAASADGLEVGTPAPLFETRLKLNPRPQYDVSADGRRFLVNVPVNEDTTTPLSVILNWTAGRGR